MAMALDDVDPALLDQLRELGRTYGPLGVALAAVKLSDPAAVVRAVMDPRRAEEFFGPEAGPARRLVAQPLAVIRAALESLPEQCRYHGENTEPRDTLFGREACCDTGLPAQRRKLAEQALRQVDADPAACVTYRPSSKGGAE